MKELWLKLWLIYYPTLDAWRYRLLTRLITLHWWCEQYLENTGHHRQRRPIFFTGLEPWIISVIIAGASFGANLLVSTLLAPDKPKQVPGKLTGDITLTDSIIGAELPRIYGGRPADESPGGVEMGCNIFWMSEIRKTSVPVPGGGGGGGKGGGGSPQPNLKNVYKFDVAGSVGAGRLRLLRMKWNEDTVYSLIGGSGGGTSAIRYEAEDLVNTLIGEAVEFNDGDFSGGQGVTGLSDAGSMIFNDVVGTSNVAPFSETEVYVPYFNIQIRYKKTTTPSDFNVLIDGAGGTRHFPITVGSEVGTIYVLQEITGSPLDNHTVEFSHPNNNGPNIDCIDVTTEWVLVESGGLRPTGILNEGFPAESAQDNILLPDPKNVDTAAFDRYNEREPEAVAGVVTAELVGGATLRWYEGDANQPIDPVIEAAIDALYGADSTPAYRGTAFFSIDSLDFTDYGFPPSIRCVVENIDTKTVEEILLVEGVLGGLTTSDFDLTAAVGRHVRGYYLAQLDPPAKAFEDLGILHMLSFAENHDGKIVAIDLTDNTAVATLTVDDLGAYVADESDEVPLDDVVSSMPEESDTLIRTLELQFLNPLSPSDYSTAKRAFTYPYTTSKKKESTSLNIVMLPEECGPLIKRELQRHHLKQAPDAIVVPHKWAWLNAGNCINVPVDGESKRRRIEEKTGSAPGVYEIKLTAEDLYVWADDGDLIMERIAEELKAPSFSATRYPANSVGTIIDIPAVLDEHDGVTGVYVAACSKGMGDWKGCQVMCFRGADNVPMAVLTKEAAIGRSVGALPSAGTVSGFLDVTNSLTVDFFGNFTPTSVTAGQAVDGANPFVAGLEVVNVTTWTRNNAYPNRWVGTNIYRGMRNTLKHKGTHVDGERVVLLSDAVKFVALDESDINVARTWKFVTYGADVADAAQILFTWAGNNQYNKESTVTVAGQTSPSTQYSISLGVSGFTEQAAFRKVEWSVNSNMSSATTVIQDAVDYPGSRLPTTFLFKRNTGTTADSYYIRTSHSSNGRDWSPPSDIILVTFTDSGMSGGSSGSFDPETDDAIFAN